MSKETSRFVEWGEMTTEAQGGFPPEILESRVYVRQFKRERPDGKWDVATVQCAATVGNHEEDSPKQYVPTAVYEFLEGVSALEDMDGTYEDKEMEWDFEISPVNYPTVDEAERVAKLYILSIRAGWYLWANE